MPQDTYARGQAGKNELGTAGCRRYTQALAWVRELDEGFDGIDRRPGEVLSIVKKAAAYVGMSPEHEVLLDKMFMLTQPQDWTGASPVGPVVWGANAFYADELNRSERSIKRLLRDLIELGLVSPRDSANGRRAGYRDDNGQIVEAYGFSLAPCGVRYDELADAAGRRISDRKERQRLKGQITREKKRIAAAAAKAQAGWELFRAWLEEVAAIVGQRARASLKRLRELAQRMVDLRIEAEAAADLSCGQDPRSGWTPSRSADDVDSSVEDGQEDQDRAGQKAARTGSWSKNTTPQGVTDDTPITTTQHLPSLREDRSSQAEWRWSQAAPFGPNPELVALEDLEKHGVTPGMVLDLVTAPRLSDLRRGEPDWGIVEAEAEQLAHDRRIDHRLVAQLVTVVGRRAAAVAVITTMRKSDRWEVRNEGGYLRRMLEIARTGELRMGRTVWGLVRAQQAGEAAFSG